MEENNKKNEIVKAMTDVEYYPSVREDEISIEKYTKLPLAEVSALGIAFEPLTSVFQNITHTIHCIQLVDCNELRSGLPTIMKN